MISVLLLALGLISASFSSILIAWGEQDLSINQVVFDRLFITTLVYGLYKVMTQVRKSIQDGKTEVRSISNESQVEEERGWSNLKEERFTIISILFLGFFFYANQLVWSWSIENTSIANSTVLHNLTPIFTATGAFLWLGQSFSKAFLIGILISIAGAIELEVGSFSFEYSHLLGDLAAVISAAFYSIYLLILERLKGRISTVDIVFLYCLAGSLLALPALMIHKDNLFPHSIRGWITVLLLSFVCQILGQALIVYCTQQLSSSIVSLSHLLCPCMSAVEAWLIFGERLTVASLVGFLTILLGLFISSFSQIKQDSVGSVVKLRWGAVEGES